MSSTKKVERLARKVATTFGASALLAASVLGASILTATASGASVQTPPAAPTWLTPTPTNPDPGVTASNGQIVLAWNASANTGYNVYEGTAAGKESSTPINGSIPVTATTPTVTLPVPNLTNGTTYYFDIVAVNAAGSSLPSLENSGEPEAAPSTVTPVTIAAGHNQVTLTWSAPAAGQSPILGYNVYVAQGPQSSSTTTDNITVATAGDGSQSLSHLANDVNTFSFVNTRTAGVLTPANGSDSDSLGHFSTANLITGTSYTVNGLTDGTGYYFVVTAVSAVGESTGVLASNNPTTPGNVTPAPSVSLAQVADSSSVTVTVTGTSSLSDTFNIYDGTTAGGESSTPVNATPVANNGVAGPTSVVVTGLNPGTKYYFTATETNTVGASPASTEASIYTGANTPGAPTAVTSVVKAHTIAVSWTAPASNGGSAITWYTVGYKLSSDSTYTTATVSTGTSYTITTLTEGASYAVEVIAHNASGDSAAAYDAATSAKTYDTTAETTADAVTGVSVEPASGSGTVALSWTAASGTALEGATTLAGYEIYVGTSASSLAPAKQVGSGSTSTQVSGLTNGTAYYFAVAAVTDAGTGAQSAVVAATIGSTTAGVPTVLGSQNVLDDGNALSIGGVVAVAFSPSAAGAGSPTSVKVYNGNVATATSLDNNLLPIVVVNHLGGTYTSLEDATTCGVAYATDLATAGWTSGPVTALESANTDAALFASDPGCFVAVGASYDGVFIAGLTGGTTYNVIIEAVNSTSGVLTSGPSAAFAVVAPAQASTPTNIALSKTSSTSATASWNAVAGATGYEIQISLDSGAHWTAVAACGNGTIDCINTAIGTSTSAVITNLTAGSTYIVRVAATVSTSAEATTVYSVWSASSAAVTLSANPLAAANAVITVVPGSSQATVTLTGFGTTPFASLTSWSVTATPGNESCSTVSEGSCVVTGLSNGTVYTFVASLTNASGTVSGGTAQAVTATPTGNPVAVTGVTAAVAAVSNNAGVTYNVTLNWTPSTNLGGGTWTSPGYTVVAKDITAATSSNIPVDNTNCVVPHTDENNGNVEVGSSTCTVTWTPASYTAGDSYTFAVEVTSTTGNATSTATAAQVLSGKASVPAQPSFTAAAGNGSVTLTVTAPTADGGSAVTGYNVYVGTAAGKEATVPVNGIIPFTPSNTSITVPGLTNGTTYYFTVTAINAIGEGAVSTENSATPVTGTAAPSGLTATSATGSVALSWTAPAANGGKAVAGYYVYEASSAGGETTPVNAALVTGTSYTVTGLSNGVKYYFEVVAENQNGYSPASDEVTATPAVVTTVTVPTIPAVVTLSFSGKSAALNAADMAKLFTFEPLLQSGASVTFVGYGTTAAIASARAHAAFEALSEAGVAVVPSFQLHVSKTDKNVLLRTTSN